MKRRYSMPLGAECRDDGSVRFRLWAPAARQVELSLAGANRSMRLPLDPCDPYSVERGELADSSSRFDSIVREPFPRLTTPCEAVTRVSCLSAPSAKIVLAENAGWRG